MHKSLIYLTLSLVIAFGCKKDDNSEPEDQSYANPTLPQNNAIIEKESTFGNSGARSSIYYTIPAIGNRYFYSGIFNASISQTLLKSNFSANKSALGDYIIGMRDVEGNVAWEVFPQNDVRDLYALTGVSGELQNALISVGEYYNESTGNGTISLYSNQGDLMQEFRDDEQSWFNAIDLLEQNSDKLVFMVAGGTLIGSEAYPYFAKIEIDLTSGEITKVQSESLPAISASWAVTFKIARDVDPVAYLFTTESDNSTQYKLHKINQDFAILWSTIIKMSYEPTMHSLNSMIYEDQKIYLSGVMKDYSKTVTQSGDYWRSGIISCVSLSGEFVWQNKLGPTPFSDYIFSFIKSGTTLYIAGKESSFIYSDQLYSNAIVVEVNSGNGNTQTIYSFGNEHYASGFNALVLVDNKIIASGYTNAKSSGSGFQGWIVRVPLSK